MNQPPQGPPYPPQGPPQFPPQGPPQGPPYPPQGPPQGPPPFPPQGPPPFAGQPPYQPPPGAPFVPQGQPAAAYPPPGAPYPPPPAPPGGWGYGYVPASARPPVRHSSHGKLIAIFVVGLLVVVGGFLLIAKSATPEKKIAKCPPTCPQPPVGDPVVARPRFTPSDGSFSVAYPKPDKIFGAATLQASSVQIPVNVGDGGAILLQGGSAGGQTAEQVVTAFIRSKFPDARRAYAIPNPLVGYQPGYGEVDDVYLQSSDGTSAHDRIVVLAAVKNDVAVLAAGIGPYHEFEQGGLTNGHPSGAGVLVALVMDPMVNSFTWKGDAKR